MKGLKTGHFKESNTAPRYREENGSMGHVECPQSEPANNDVQLGPNADGRSGALRRSWGSTGKRSAGICGCQSQATSTIGFEDGEAKTSHSDPRR